MSKDTLSWNGDPTLQPWFPTRAMWEASWEAKANPKPTPTRRVVAFTGYAGAGKDEAAKPLLEAGYSRFGFGDLIKNELEDLTWRAYGFSAHTENRNEKAKIRRALEFVGDDYYDYFLTAYLERVDSTFADLFNPRLMRTREGRAFVERGYPIIEIVRPGVGPASEFERLCVAELHAEGLVSWTIQNDGTPEDLHQKVLSTLRMLDKVRGKE